jgi:hypothetical protein
MMMTILLFHPFWERKCASAKTSPANNKKKKMDLHHDENIII